jgi:hypothetical protein
MHKLPMHLVPHADQAKAKADDTLTKMITALRGDIEHGYDTSYLWWELADRFAVLTSPSYLATGLATALLRLAADPVSLPEDAPMPAMAAAAPLRHRSRVFKLDPRLWATVCLTCDASYPCTSQADALFLANYHWSANG